MKSTKQGPSQCESPSVHGTSFRAAAVNPFATRQSRAGPAATMPGQKIAAPLGGVREPATGSSETARQVTAGDGYDPAGAICKTVVMNERRCGTCAPLTHGRHPSADRVVTRRPQTPHDRERLLHRTRQGLLMSTSASAAVRANDRSRGPRPQPATEDDALIGDLPTLAGSQPLI
jgi:hypothetical protein